MSHQPVFEAQYVEQRSRLTTFFRWVLAIPHLLVMTIWGLVAGIAVFVAWFALLFTGAYPKGLYDFVAGFLRYATAVSAYLGLLTDGYPPFSGDTSGYPVQLRIPEPKPDYNRMKVLLRIILMIPVYIIAYAMSIVAQVGTLLAWFAIVILGRQPKGLQDMIVLGLSYQMRAYAYYALLTEDWPPFIDQRGGAIEGPPGGAPLPPAPEYTAAPSSSFAAPESPTTTAPAVPPPESGEGLTGGDPLRGD